MKTLFAITISAIMSMVASASTVTVNVDFAIMAYKAERQISEGLVIMNRLGMTDTDSVYNLLDRHYGPVNRAIRMRYPNPRVLVNGEIDTPLERAATWHLTKYDSVKYTRTK